MPNVYFTSDLHLGHRKVAALRGYGDDEAAPARHDLKVIYEWHDAVRPGDVVWILGDLSAGGSSATRRALDILGDLPGRKRLILGNHDPAHPGINRDAHKWWPEFARVFESFSPFARARVDGVEVALSHFPYTRDRAEARYLQWRLRDEGLPLLHGHTHGPERLVATPEITSWGCDRAIVRPRVEVHVGWDAWGRLVPASEVAALLREGLDARI